MIARARGNLTAIMKIQVLNEGVVFKGAAESSTRTALKGCSALLPSGEIVHTMQAATARTSQDGRCLLVRSTDGGQTWSPPEPVLPESEYSMDRAGFGAWP